MKLITVLLLSLVPFLHVAAQTRSGGRRSQVAIQGRVEYPDGSPAKRAHVEAITVCSDLHVAYLAQTDSEGRFSIDRFDGTCNKYEFSASQREAYWLPTGDDFFYISPNGTNPIVEMTPGKEPAPVLLHLQQRGGEMEIRAFDEANQSFIFAGFGVSREPVGPKVFHVTELFATGLDGSPSAIFLSPGNYVLELLSYSCNGKEYFAAKPPSTRFSVKVGERQPLTLKLDIANLRPKSSVQNPEAKPCSP